MAKFGMSMVVLGVAGEYRGRVGINALWPRTMIDTAAMAEFKPHLDIGPLRSPEILADAAHIILTSEATTNTGTFYIDDEGAGDSRDCRSERLRPGRGRRPQSDA
jgi:citronellol/citronellal dehydrogenase